MALTWDGLTVTTWFHRVSESPEGPIEKDIQYPESIGRDVMNLGSKATGFSSKRLVYAPAGQGRQNAFKDTSAANIETTISSLLTKQLASTLGTLADGTDTFTNMKLARFERIGPIYPVIQGGTTFYCQNFLAIFEQYDQ